MNSNSDDNKQLTAIHMVYDEKSKEIRAQGLRKDCINIEMPDPNVEYILQVSDSTVDPVILPEDKQNQINANFNRRITNRALQEKMSRARNNSNQDYQK